MTADIGDWIASHETPDSPFIPAATVLLGRDTESGPEILMMRRSSKLSFAEGAWVFPGGRIDRADYAGVAGDDHAGAARRAAVRETHEEGNLVVEGDSLVHYSHWLPPMGLPKRFSTWFFLGPAPDGEVVVDDGEIIEHAWWRPADALDRVEQKRIEVLPPTWMTLRDLTQFASVAEAVVAVQARGTQRFATKIVPDQGAQRLMWEGDAAYESGDASIPGPRQRLTITADGWDLEVS